MLSLCITGKITLQYEKCENAMLNSGGAGLIIFHIYKFPWNRLDGKEQFFFKLIQVDGWILTKGKLKIEFYNVLEIFFVIHRFLVHTVVLLGNIDLFKFAL